MLNVLYAVVRFARTVARLLSPRGWALAAAVLAAALGLAAYSYQKARTDRAEARLAPAVATVKALDRVATQIPAIRGEQEEKSREVDQIPGADQRLPDGFGAELERVRRGERDRHP